MILKNNFSYFRWNKEGELHKKKWYFLLNNYLIFIFFLSYLIIKLILVNLFNNQLKSSPLWSDSTGFHVHRRKSIMVPFMLVYLSESFLGPSLGVYDLFGWWIHFLIAIDFLSHIHTSLWIHPAIWGSLLESFSSQKLQPFSSLFVSGIIFSGQTGE